jgi:hypothetical protein
VILISVLRPVNGFSHRVIPLQPPIKCTYILVHTRLIDIAYLTVGERLLAGRRKIIRIES